MQPPPREPSSAPEAGGDPALIGCPWLSPGEARDQRPDPGRLRIATFNAEWLFDGVGDPSHVPWADPAAGQTHLVQVAEEVASASAIPRAFSPSSYADRPVWAVVLTVSRICLEVGSWDLY